MKQNYYYNPNKLLSLKDLNGREPEIRFLVGNKTAGKTFAAKYYDVRRFKEHREKFVVFTRWKTDLPGKVRGFFDKDIGPIKFPRHRMSQKSLMGGFAQEIYFDDIPCGYVIAINDVDRVKDNSSMFSDAKRWFFDEFIPESGRYCPDEIRKFNSIRIAIARGGSDGTHARPFPGIMCSNKVTQFNPYFDYFGITNRLQPRTKFLRGDGWVLEQTHNKFAAQELRDNFHTISEEELQYAADNAYMLDSSVFVENIAGLKRPMCTIRFNKQKYTVWSTAEETLYLVSSKLKAPAAYVLTTQMSDHEPGVHLVTRGDYVYKALRKAYNEGRVRFDSGSAKHAFLTTLMMI